jgi:hypothetical protein
MTREEMEQVIDALEYRVAQLEDRVWKEGSETDKRSLRHRRQMYYKVVNRATADA